MITKEISDIIKDIMDTKDIQSFMDDIESDIECLEDDIEKNRQEASEIEGKLEDVDTQAANELLGIELETLDDELEEYQQDIHDLQNLLDKLQDIKSEVPEFEDGNNLVSLDSWVDYVKELLEDCGDIPKDIPHYIVIDWELTAENIAEDYGIIDIDGTDYYFRNC